MTDREAMQMALDALTIFREWEMGQDYNSNRETVLARAFKAEEILSAALAQPEQEPYGYLWFTRYMEHRFTHRIPEEAERIGDVKPVYTAPPKREWQGLTYEEVVERANAEYDPENFARGVAWASIKLKEKNT